MAKKKEPNQENKKEEPKVEEILPIPYLDQANVTRREFAKLFENVRIATAYAKGAYHHIYGPGTKPKDL